MGVAALFLSNVLRGRERELRRSVRGWRWVRLLISKIEIMKIVARCAIFIDGGLRESVFVSQC
jgi:hypothetical protein